MTKGNSTMVIRKFKKFLNICLVMEKIIVSLQRNGKRTITRGAERKSEGEADAGLFILRLQQFAFH